MRDSLFAGTNDETENEKLLKALGDTEVKRKELKQTADHIVLILNDYGGPFRCITSYPIWSHKQDLNLYLPSEQNKKRSRLRTQSMPYSAAQNAEFLFLPYSNVSQHFSSFT